MRGQPVVVGVDASDASRAATGVGSRIAAAAGGELHLVTAVLDPVAEVMATRLRLDPLPIRAAAERRARDKVSAALAGAAPGDLVDRALVARTGRPERVLVHTVREVGAGLVVLGGKHHRGASSWIRRGTPHHLLRALDVPILVTGPRSADIARVLAAVDLSFAAAAVLAAAHEVSALLGVPLDALHVVDDALFERGERMPIELDDVVRSSRERLDAEIWTRLEPTAGRSLRVGPVTDTLAAAAREGPPALLVVGAQGGGWIDRLLLGSTTEELLARLPSSLLVVPCAAAPEASAGGSPR